MSAHCKACGAEIVWAVTTNAKLIPLDAAPNPVGNMWLSGATLLTKSGSRGPHAVHIGPPGLLPDDRVRYMPHHATCPSVDEFRR